MSDVLVSDSKLPLGYKYAAVKSGLKNNDYDLSVIISSPAANFSALYTKNKLKASPVIYSKKYVKNKISALVLNSGQANSLTGEEGFNDAVSIAEKAAEVFNLKKENILLASTGIIGKRIEKEKIISSLESAKELLVPYPGYVPHSIRTTDKYEKTAQESIVIDGIKANFYAFAKGASNIHPNMATVLLFILSDLNIETSAMNSAFTSVLNKTLNRISVDGEMSTNDTAVFLANGKLNNKLITEKTKTNYNLVINTLEKLCYKLSKLIVLDGEGATKFITVNVKRAKTQTAAFNIAKTIATSTTVKILFFAQDTNFSHILMAAGKCDADINIEKVKITVNDFVFFENGKKNNDLDLNKLKDSMRNKEQMLEIDLGYSTKFEDFYMFSDLTPEYISVSASYR